MIKWQIELNTMHEIQKFVGITTKYQEDLFVENEDKTFRVSAKSMMGMIYSTEWGSKVYLTAETEPKGLFTELADYIK